MKIKNIANYLNTLRFFISVWIFSAGTIGLLSSCSSDDKKADTAEGAYAIAQEYDTDERYEEAIRRYTEVKNKYPYSRFALLSELAIADVYFKQESFAEAQIAYQTFKDLHPKHAQIDYVTFRIALSYFNQLPATTDRDLTQAHNAITVFDEVMAQYPNSDYAKEAATKKTEALKMLVTKEDYIAEFYFVREKWDSALSRYEGLLRKFPGLGFDDKALARASVAAYKLGDQQKAYDFLSQLEKRFPDSKEIKFVKKESQE